MKRKSLILILFMLVLFQIPQTRAAYLDESPQSITSFSETLPDDVLYYPDFDLESNVSTTTEYIDNMESVSYWDSAAKDWDTWETADGALHTRHDSVGANEYPLRHMDWDDNDDPDPRPEVTEYDDTTYSWYLRFKVDYHDSADYFRIGFYDTPWGGTSEWFNLLTYSKNVWHYVEYDPTTTMTDLDRIDVNAQLDNGEYAELWLDWIAVIPTANNLDPSFSYDDTSFREGFNDVSDWTNVGNAEMTTDGDVANISCTGGSNGQMVSGQSEGFTNVTNSNSLYIEHNFVTKSASAEWDVRLYYDNGGDLSTIDEPYWSSSLGTYKMFVDIPADSVIYKVGIYIRPVGEWVLVDYFRISPANESGGWQHDGSTTESIVTQYGRADISSDDDVLIVNSTVSGARILIKSDNTDTKIEVDTDEYQFVEWKVTDAYDADSSGGVWKLRVFDIDGIYTASYYPVSGYSSDTGIFRLNLKAWCDASSLSGLYYFKFYFNSANDDFGLDYIKVYSIANYSLTQSAGTDPSTVLYVENNALIWSLATSVYITLAHDPALSVDTSIYTTVTANITKADSSAVVGFNWEETISGARWRLVDEKTAVMQSGTLTDMRTSIDVSGTWTLSSIKFIDTRDWQEIGEVDFVIPVGWDPTFQFGYDAFFIFLGLIMIPVSTMYLVRGGREEMSSDKLFYGLIIFAVGFGLLVGGIMP